MKRDRSEITLAKLSQAWESLLHLEGISAESGYRICRLIDRAVPLAGKIFLKTVKGREMMAQCAEKTLLVREQLESRGESIYGALTELERTYEDLLKRVYEFRVKAG